MTAAALARVVVSAAAHAVWNWLVLLNAVRTAQRCPGVRAAPGAALTSSSSAHSRAAVLMLVGILLITVHG